MEYRERYSFEQRRSRWDNNRYKYADNEGCTFVVVQKHPRSRMVYAGSEIKFVVLEPKPVRFLTNNIIKRLVKEEVLKEGMNLQFYIERAIPIKGEMFDRDLAYMRDVYHDEDGFLYIYFSEENPLWMQHFTLKNMVPLLVFILALLLNLFWSDIKGKLT